MQKAPYVFPIIGGRKVEHLLANLEALEIALTDEQIKRLESVTDFSPGFPAWLIVYYPPFRLVYYSLLMVSYRVTEHILHILWQARHTPIGHFSNPFDPRPENSGACRLDTR